MEDQKLEHRTPSAEQRMNRPAGLLLAAVPVFGWKLATSAGTTGTDHLVPWLIGALLTGAVWLGWEIFRPTGDILKLSGAVIGWTALWASALSILASIVLSSGAPRGWGLVVMIGELITSFPAFMIALLFGAIALVLFNAERR
jgi:hypothetical protein